MRRSLIAALVVAGLGLLSMGVLGALLYYMAAPALWPLYGNLNDWRGDDVWPATIGVGILWSLSFLVAGWLNRRLKGAGWTTWPRRVVYALVLWLGAVLLWLFMASTMTIAFVPTGV